VQLKNIVLSVVLIVVSILIGVCVGRIVDHPTFSGNITEKETTINTLKYPLVKIIKQYEAPADTTLTSYKIISTCIDHKYVILSEVYGGYSVEVVYNNGIPQSCDEQ